MFNPNNDYDDDDVAAADDDDERINRGNVDYVNNLYLFLRNMIFFQGLTHFPCVRRLAMNNNLHDSNAHL